jgi:hypothetical protein
MNEENALILVQHLCVLRVFLLPCIALRHFIFNLDKDA